MSLLPADMGPQAGCTLYRLQEFRAEVLNHPVLKETLTHRNTPRYTAVATSLSSSSCPPLCSPSTLHPLPLHLLSSSPPPPPPPPPPLPTITVMCSESTVHNAAGQATLSRDGYRPRISTNKTLTMIIPGRFWTRVDFLITQLQDCVMPAPGLPPSQLPEPAVQASCSSVLPDRESHPEQDPATPVVSLAKPFRSRKKDQ
ncbi:unnamed protein product [Pleuronectes platessa]|uniref:Uncharacterized protein n=1 Tax=Pleuronectes platessa TaxID=8262 RepID=A0A9N7U5A3_PLEPL|nr:unnamed protein product [Pleuronectes platessa]